MSSGVRPPMQTHGRAGSDVPRAPAEAEPVAAEVVVVLTHGAISQVLDRTEGDVLSEASLFAAIHQEAEAVA